MSKDILENIVFPIFELQGYIIQKELQFAKELKRRFRADYFIPFHYVNLSKGILIEYNGVNFKNSNLSRHTNTVGAIRDMEKLNLAQELDYIVLQYNVKSLENYDQVIKQIQKIIDKKDRPF
jgi:hypothetical protein